MGISGDKAQVPQDGGKKMPHHKKKNELGCLAANIKIGPSHIPQSVCRWATRSFMPWGWVWATSPVALSAVCAKHRLLMLSTMHPTMNWSSPRSSWKHCTVLLDSTPHHSGTCLPRHCARATWRGPRRLLRKQRFLNKKHVEKVGRCVLKGQRIPKSAVFWRSWSCRARFCVHRFRIGPTGAQSTRC